MVDFPATLDPTQVLRSLTRISRAWDNVSDEVREHNRTVNNASSSVQRLSTRVSGFARIAGARVWSVFTTALKAIGVAVVASAGAFLLAAKNLGDFATQLDEAAMLAGVNTRRYQQLKGAFDDYGVSVDNVFKGVNDATRRALAGDTVFADLNIDIEEFLSLDSEGKARALARALRDVDDSNRRAALSQRIGGEEFVKTANALVSIEENYEDNLSAQAAFSVGTVANLRIIGDVFGDFSRRTRVLLGDALSTFAPAFQAFQRFFNSEVFPYLQDTAIPAFQNLFNTQISPFFSGLIGSRTTDSVQAEIDELFNSIDASQPFSQIDSTLTRINELRTELAAVGEGQRTATNLTTFFMALNVIFESTGVAAETAAKGISDFFTPAIDGISRALKPLLPLLEIFLDNLDEIDIEGTIESALAFLTNASAFGGLTSRLGFLGNLFSFFRNFGEDDVEEYAALAFKFFTRVLNRVLTLVGEFDFGGKLIPRLTSGLVKLADDAVLLIFGDEFGASIVNALSRLLPASIRMGIGDALQGITLGTVAKTALTRLAGSLTGGLIDGIVEAFRGGDSGDILYESLLGAITTGLLIANPPVGIGAIVARLFFGDVFKDEVSAVFKDTLDGFQERAENFVNFDFWYNLGALIANEFIAGLDNLRIAANVLIRQFENAGILGVDLNPINLGTIDPIQPIALRPITRARENTGFTDFASGGNIVNSAVGGAFAGDLRVIVNIDGTEIDQSTYRSFIRLVQNGTIEGIAQ